MPIPEQELLKIQESLRAALQGGVKIDYFHRRKTALLVPGQEPCESCEEVKAVLEQLADASDLIDLQVYAFDEERDLATKRQIDRVPGIVVRGEVNRPLRFFGLPGGALFPVFLQTLVDASVKSPTPAPEVARALKKLRKPVQLHVFGSLTDPHSGEAARLALRLAVVSPRVRTSVYAIEEFPELGEQFGVQAIPATVVDERLGLAGVVEDPADFAQYLFEMQAYPDRARLRRPAVRPGTGKPWQRPRSPEEAGDGQQQQQHPGERRTASGLILPGS